MMMNNFYSLLLLTLIITCYSCGSGEYELDEVKVDYVEKTPVYDTIKVIKDTTTKIDIKDTKLENYAYVVQIGAFNIKSNFDKFLEKAKLKIGSEVYFVFTNNLYKIRIGKFKIKSEAFDLMRKVQNLGYSDAFVITTKD
jgi:hypothetical protein